MITSYRIAPRYTPGSPATLGEQYEPLARQVAAEERRAYFRALSGRYGEQAKADAERFGPFGIVTKIVRAGRGGKHITIIDLIA